MDRNERDGIDLSLVKEFVHGSGPLDDITQSDVDRRVAAVEDEDALRRERIGICVGAFFPKVEAVQVIVRPCNAVLEIPHDYSPDGHNTAVERRCIAGALDLADQRNVVERQGPAGKADVCA